MDADGEELVDLIYEAAAVPAQWQKVLHSLSDIAGAEGTTIFTGSSPETARWESTEGTRDLIERFILDGWLARNSRGRRTERLAEPRFVSETDLYEPEELPDDPMHRDFLWPRGFGWGTGTRISIPTGETIVFSSERLLRNGPVPQSAVDRLTDLRPHLARAALLSTRLRFQQYGTAVTALHAVGLAAAVIGTNRRVLAMNSTFQALADVVRIGSGDRLIIVDGEANRRVTDILGEIPKTARPVRSSIPIRSSAAGLPSVLHLIPIRRAALDVFENGIALMLITPFRDGSDIREDVVRSLFDLTVVEARICRSLVAGKSIEEIAGQSNVSHETVRKQIKRVFSKTNTHRQGQLIALLSSVPAI